MSADLLFELGVEELPARAIAPAIAQGREFLVRHLAEARLPHGAVSTCATPRRLTWHVADLAARGADSAELVVGPPESAAYADGKPTSAFQGFARKCKVDPGALELVAHPEGKGGRYLGYRRTIPGALAAVILPELLGRLVSSLSFARSMHWVEGQTALTFARPLRSLVALHGDSVVPVTFGPVASGRVTRGHPFLAKRKLEATLRTADLIQYQDALRERFVLAAVDERKARIRAGLVAATTVVDEDLLDEVTNLVEWPTVVEGAFDPAFLALPGCVLTETMAKHQRYFPVVDAKNRLAPRFLAVINRGPASADVVRAGNERVLRARLADARYFVEVDHATPLEELARKLAGRSFHPRLGTLADKCTRLARLAPWVAERLGGDDEAQRLAARAGAIAKFDLASEMVAEFPSLEGRIGRVYAERAGEPARVALANEDHYRPRQADDEVPKDLVSRALGIAERLDDLVGLHAAGEAPTGSRDPHGLRRKALGLVRLVRTDAHPFDLALALAHAAAGHAPALRAGDATAPLAEFVLERARQLWLDDGRPHDLIAAAMGIGAHDLGLCHGRILGLVAMAREPWWGELAAIVERATNIHKREAAPAVEPGVDRLELPVERELAARLDARTPALAELARGRRWLEFARAYHEAFGEIVARFFVEVFVNVEDPVLRAQRLALLRRVGELFRANVGDLTLLSASKPA